MKTEKNTWPGVKAPTKEEIERMYRLAYMIDHQYFRKEDVVFLGLDIHRLKEFGEVRMSKSLSRLRKHVDHLWKRLSGEQRAAYIMADVITELKNVGHIIRELEKEIGEVPEAHEGISLIQNGLFARIPTHLRERLEKGFGKWKVSEIV